MSLFNAKFIKQTAEKVMSEELEKYEKLPNEPCHCYLAKRFAHIAYTTKGNVVYQAMIKALAEYCYMECVYKDPEEKKPFALNFLRTVLRPAEESNELIHFEPLEKPAIELDKLEPYIKNCDDWFLETMYKGLTFLTLTLSPKRRETIQKVLLPFIRAVFIIKAKLYKDLFEFENIDSPILTDKDRIMFLMMNYDIIRRIG